MSIVDTWDWDKLKNDTKAEAENFEIDADTKVRTAVYEFENEFGIFPNRIIMGSNLADELSRTFLNNTIPMKTLEELAMVRELGIRVEYEGIPVKIDYDNQNNLEVGYMVKWMENKYE